MVRKAFMTGALLGAVSVGMWWTAGTRAADESKESEEAKKLVAKGKTLFKTKICFTCHQVDPKTPAPAGAALKAPAFMGKFWGTKRQVHDGIDPDTGKPSEKILTVVFNEAYFIESVKKPMAKIVKGSVPGMVQQPLKDDEIKALMYYVRSLSTEK